MKLTIRQQIIGNLVGASVVLTAAFLIITIAGWTVERDYGHPDLTYVEYVKGCFKYLVELIKDLW